MPNDIVRIDWSGIRIKIVRKPIKNVYIRAESGDTLLVSAPLRKSVGSIEELIKKHPTRIKKMLENRKNIPVFSDTEVMYFGKTYIGETGDSKQKKVVFTGDRFIFPALGQAEKEAALEDFYRKETKREAITMMDLFPQEFLDMIGKGNVLFRSRKMKTRLGSCEPRKRHITLNSVLARFDRRYLKAILTHELVHLRIGGHQQDFYELLLSCEPDYRSIRKELDAMMRETGL